MAKIFFVVFLLVFPFIFASTPEIIQHLKRAADTDTNTTTCILRNCNSTNCTNFECDLGNCIQVVSIGSVCSEDVICESGTECINSTCVRPIDAGCACDSYFSCYPSNLVCAGDSRCGYNRSVGALCDENSYCHSNICNQYQCTCSGLNQTCTEDDDCCTEFCSSQGLCQTRHWTKTGFPCVNNQDCVSGLCINNTCVRFFSTELGGACQTTLGVECVPGLTCVGGVCAPPAENCSSSCGLFGQCTCLADSEPVCKQVLNYTCVPETFNAYSDCLEECLIGNFADNADGCNYNCYVQLSDFICCLKISPHPVIQTHFSHSNCETKEVCELSPCCTPGGCTTFETVACIPPPQSWVSNSSTTLNPILAFFVLYILAFVL